MKRREFITLLGGAAAWPWRRVHSRAAAGSIASGFSARRRWRRRAHFLNAFRDGMRERGYVEGRNSGYRLPRARGSRPSARDVAVKLVRSGCDLIGRDLAGSARCRRRDLHRPHRLRRGRRPGGSGHGGQPAAAGSKRHRHRQFRQRSGWQESSSCCARSTQAPPPRGAQSRQYRRHDRLRQIEDAARALGLELQVVNVRVPGEFERLRPGARRGRPGRGDDGRPLVDRARGQDRRAGATAWLPTVFQRRENADAGGLLSYGPNIREASTRSPGMSIASSRASRQPTYRSSRRLRSSCSSISRRQKGARPYRAGYAARARRRGYRMSNCVVGSGGFELPCSIIAEHSVEGSDHFSHDGDDDDLVFLSASARRLEKALRAGLYRLALRAAM